MSEINLGELKDYFEKFEKMQSWMINDLRNASIKAHANFLVGMGIFNYIDILGSFYHFEEEKGTSYSKKRFDFVFSELMGSNYSSIYFDLDKLTKSGAYDIFRCGLTHEYFIKTYQMNDPSNSLKFTIYGTEGDAQYMQNIATMECGIDLVTLDHKDYHLRIYNPRLIYDLNQAFEKYKKFVRSDATDSFGSYRERFMERCKKIQLENFS